ncbi:MAG: arabinooligosaccharide transport system substrate-binding protein [Thermomicrobiales bacterium]|jgi:multiple sugar transport system substrate-binding protein|nr:arabinooligosaccharide transport system substrate-binding protein [Thermomicrobiales bacterium]
MAERVSKRFTRRDLLELGAKGSAVGALAAAGVGLSQTPAAAVPSTPGRQRRQAPMINAQSQVKLTLYGWYLPSEPVFKKITDAFTQEFPNITVDVVIPNQYIMDQLKVEFAAGRGPDVTCMNTPSGTPWIQRGAFLPLQDLVTSDATYAENLKALVPWTVEAYSQNGILYGTPITAESTTIFYNEDLVTQAGLPSFAEIENDPAQWNWDKLREYATAINKGTDDGPDRIYGIHSLGGLQVVWLNFVYGNGGEYLSPDGLKCNIAQQPAVDALKYLYDLRYTHNVASPPDPFIQGQGMDSAALFQSGRLGIHPWGEWQIAVYNGFNENQGLPFAWNIAQPPFSPTGQRSAVSHSVAVVVNKNTKHPAESFEFVKFMARPEVQGWISSEGWGSLSAHPGTYDSWLNDPKAPKNRQAIIASQAYGRPYPNCPVLETAEVQDPLNSILHEQIWYGERDLAEGLKEIEDSTNDLIEQAKAGS